MLPPFEKNRVTDQLEPWSELEAGIREHRLEFLLRDVSCVLDFVWIG